MEEQARLAKEQEELNKSAAKQELEMAKVQAEAMTPDNHRQWVTGPFASYAAKPTKFDLWDKVPLGATRFSLLTKDYLESVSLLFLLYAMPFISGCHL